MRYIVSNYAQELRFGGQTFSSISDAELEMSFYDIEGEVRNLDQLIEDIQSDVDSGISTDSGLYYDGSLMSSEKFLRLFK